MKRSLLFTTLGLFLFACSGAVSEVDDPTGSTEDDLSAAQACAGKSCGDPCSLCPPGKPGCFETAVPKACNAKGRCKAGVPVCDAIDAGPAPEPIPADGGAADAGEGALDGGAAYEPCGGKSCGDACSLCAPWDIGCVETAVLKFCHSDGKCLATPPACIPPPPPPPYDPCGGKSCGDLCSLCAPTDPGCVETAVVKQCNAAGECVANVVVCK